MSDSLILSDQIELFGSVPSTIASCAGAVFHLAPGFDLSAPMPVSDFVANLVLDGEVPVGRRASNRTIQLPICITTPSGGDAVAARTLLVAAREVLARAVNQDHFTLRWTREGGLPLVFDCYRAGPMNVTYATLHERQLVAQVSITCSAAPYGRSDTPVSVQFQSPLAGMSAPPSPVTIDAFGSVSGTQWSASAAGPTGSSAYWNPAASPASNPAGLGMQAAYAKTGLSLNLAQGWDVTAQATGTTSTVIITQAAMTAAGIDVGDQFQLKTSGGALIQPAIFTVGTISPPSGGNVTVGFSPPASAATVATNHAVQTGPPSLNAVTFLAGFGSTQFFHNWARLGGPVHFKMTLTDTYGTTVSFSKVYPKVYGSNNGALPKWTKVRLPVAYKAGFDYANVTGYTLQVSNRGAATLEYTGLYLDTLTAVPPTTQVATPQRGVVYDLAGMTGSARTAPSFQFQQAGAYVTNVQAFSQPYVQFWTCPQGVTSVAVFCIGGGGGGAAFFANGGGGGGGGGTAANASVAVTPGQSYQVTVGPGGTIGTDGAVSIFQGDSVSVTAIGGHHGSGSSGGAGGAAGAGGFAGGTAGAGTATSTGGGGAGGGSAGTAANGNTGGAASGATGGVPAAAVTNGGRGGRGGTHNVGNGQGPTAGYGGGAGGSPGGGFGASGNGYSGLVQLTYLTPPAFRTLVAHRPGYDQDDNFCPFVSLNPGDPVDATIAYTVPSLTPGLNARFSGTYSVVLVSNVWNNPTAARTITVTVTMYDQPGGNPYYQSVAWTLTPSNLIPSGTPFAVIGNLTLPGAELAPENLNAYYTVSINDTNISDTFWDLLFLDTAGSTVMVNAPFNATNMWVDAPAAMRDIGLILGSTFDRSTAVSILSGAQAISGGPLTIDPAGNASFLCYSVEGAPSCEMVYSPKWLLDRLS
jgi:hypothetical protein